MELACNPPLGVEEIVYPSSLVTAGEHNHHPCVHKKKSMKKKKKGWPYDENDSKKKKKKKKSMMMKMKKNGWPYDCEGDENDAKYRQIVEGSEGFDSFTDPTSTMSGDIRPCSLHAEVVKNAAKFAIEQHNKTTAENIIFKKIVKANAQFQMGLMLYITLETVDGDTGDIGDQTQPVFYEAKVLEDIHGVFQVNIFRKALHYKPKGGLELNHPHSSTKGTAQRYQESGSENISSQKRAFFDAHKDEEWLKNKYHPTNLLGVIERRNELAQKIAKDFLLYLFEGVLDLNPGVTAFSPSKPGQTSEPNSDDEAADAGRKRRKHDKGHDEESDFSAALKAHPVSSEHRRIQSDIKQAHALVQKLDMEKGIKGNVLCDVHFLRSKFGSQSLFPIVVIQGFPAERFLYGNQLLDTLLTYLWRIHGVNYYGMIESDEPKGFRHVRPDGKNHGETSESGVEREKKLDSLWRKRLRGRDPLEAMIGKEKIVAADIESLDQYVRKIDGENNGWNLGCEAKGCTELFDCAECAREHLKLKHPELVMELSSKVREDLYFHNYMSDPDACGGTPDMQQP